MLCQNCGKNEANIRYTQIINGVRKEVALCSDCARKLGLENIGIPDLSMNFHSILGDFFNDYAESMLLPSIENNTIKCKKCGMSYNDFIKDGMFGCEECYDTFQDPIDSLLKNLHGTAKHVGRGINGKNDEKIKIDNEENDKTNSKNKDKTTGNNLQELHEKLDAAIRDERYEDAAKIRDEIKKLEKNNKDNK